MKSSHSLYNITEIELTYRSNGCSKSHIKISGAHDAAQVFRANWNEGTIELLEQFKVLLLAQDNRCLGISDIAIGGISACHVDQRIIFALALKAKSSGIIFCHNHPSGNLKPSNSDIAITNRLIDVGDILGIGVRDHIILTKDEYFSFAENGLIAGSKLIPA